MYYQLLLDPIASIILNCDVKLWPGFLDTCFSTKSVGVFAGLDIGVMMQAFILLSISVGASLR